MKITWGNKTWHFLVQSFWYSWEVKGSNPHEAQQLSIGCCRLGLLPAWTKWERTPDSKRPPSTTGPSLTLHQTTTWVRNQADPVKHQNESSSHIWHENFGKCSTTKSFPSTGSHKHSNHFLGTFDWSWRSPGEIKHGIFLDFPFQRLEKWKGSNPQQLSIGCCCCLGLSPAWTRWERTPDSKRPSSTTRPSLILPRTTTTWVWETRRTSYCKTCLWQCPSLANSPLTCPLAPIYIYLGVSRKVLQGAHYFLYVNLKVGYWWTIDLPSLPSRLPALQPKAQEDFGHRFSVEILAGLRETLELNQLKSAPSQLLPGLPGFDRLQTCCHWFGPANILKFSFPSAG